MAWRLLGAIWRKLLIFKIKVECNKYCVLNLLIVKRSLVVVIVSGNLKCYQSKEKPSLTSCHLTRAALRSSSTGAHVEL